MRSAPNPQIPKFILYFNKEFKFKLFKFLNNLI